MYLAYRARDALARLYMVFNDLAEPRCDVVGEFYCQTRSSDIYKPVDAFETPKVTDITPFERICKICSPIYRWKRKEKKETTSQKGN